MKEIQIEREKLVKMNFKWVFKKKPMYMKQKTRFRILTDKSKNSKIKQLKLFKCLFYIKLNR